MMIDSKCIECDNIFQTNCDNSNFCSWLCKSRYHGKKSLLIDWGKVNCKICNTEFKKKSDNQLYCSKECGRNAKTKHKSKYTCKCCRKTFQGTKKFYCSDECKKMMYSHTKINFCKHCNKSFAPKNGNRVVKYCDNDCMQAVNKRNCKGCGKTYLRRDTHHKGEYCNSTCHQRTRRKSHDEYMREFILIHGHMLVPLQLYSGNDKTLKCLCLRCNNTMEKRALSYVGVNSHGCKTCFNSSKGETIIRNYLTFNRIKFIQHYRFADLKNKEYDFYLPEDNLIVEVHGQQHFEEVHIFEKDSEKERENDLFKKQHILSKGINYMMVDYREHNPQLTLDRFIEQYEQFIG